VRVLTFRATTITGDGAVDPLGLGSPRYSRLRSLYIRPDVQGVAKVPDPPSPSIGLPQKWRAARILLSPAVHSSYTCALYVRSCTVTYACRDRASLVVSLTLDGWSFPQGRWMAKFDLFFCSQTCTGLFSHACLYDLRFTHKKIIALTNPLFLS